MFVSACSTIDGCNIRARSARRLLNYYSTGPIQGSDPAPRRAHAVWKHRPPAASLRSTIATPAGGIASLNHCYKDCIPTECPDGILCYKDCIPTECPDGILFFQNSEFGIQN
jgi:hypothetical protein